MTYKVHTRSIKVRCWGCNQENSEWHPTCCSTEVVYDLYKGADLVERGFSTPEDALSWPERQKERRRLEIAELKERIFQLEQEEAGSKI